MPPCRQTIAGQFDGLVADARRLYGLRDENGPITAEWPGGILRMILLEVGRRLVAAGRLRTVDHVFDLSAVELTGALRGEPGPRAEAVATRHDVGCWRVPVTTVPHTSALTLSSPTSTDSPGPWET